MYNPRYLCYCSANNKSPEDMLKYDEQKWPGGKMGGFIIWCRENLNAFLKEFPEHNRVGTLKNQLAHDEYDKWLNTKYGVVNEN